MPLSPKGNHNRVAKKCQVSTTKVKETCIRPKLSLANDLGKYFLQTSSQARKDWINVLSFSPLFIFLLLSFFSLHLPIF